MMPGHTHCDVDARFGNFSTFLNAKECGSPQELISAFLECIPGEAHMTQSIYNFKEVLTRHCYNYGTVKSMYDFHIYLDGNNEPTIENARFALSETLLCGTRQNHDSFISKLFKKTPPLDLQFQLVLPKTELIDKMLPNIKKWEKVISAGAKNDLLHLKETIDSHVGTPFTVLLQKIQDKQAPVEPQYTAEVEIATNSTENEIVRPISVANEQQQNAASIDAAAAEEFNFAEENFPDDATEGGSVTIDATTSSTLRRSRRLNALHVPASSTASTVSRKRQRVKD
uniref:Uncharacterized protein n=1 Tax=Panagrolaimus sp. ES5 TaxID=591445 RepID=A0AC34G8J7_9BILA